MFLQIFMTCKSTLNEPNKFLCHFLHKKDSKSRRKSRTNAKLVPRPNPCVRTDGRTYVRTYVTSKFSQLHGLPIIWLWMLRTHAPSARAGAPLLKVHTLKLITIVRGHQRRKLYKNAFVEINFILLLSPFYLQIFNHSVREKFNLKHFHLVPTSIRFHRLRSPEDSFLLVNRP